MFNLLRHGFAPTARLAAPVRTTVATHFTPTSTAPRVAFSTLLRSFMTPRPSLLRPTVTPPSASSVRFNSTLQPRKVKYRKAHKGRVPVRIGGSQKGNTMVYGDYGLRVKHGVRMTGRQLSAILFDLKRRLKPFKGFKIWLRVFPDIPVTSKGNEVRMGKGKGDLSYWACRVPKDKIVLEIKGPGIRPEIAKELLRVAIFKMPVKTVIVYREEEEKVLKKKLEAAAAAAGDSVPPVDVSSAPTPVA
ncbi:39S ribosomal protein L16, mitochondrial [Tieghemiomyces parasiticus]|uniref:39S ribosomal protein L16, mitochondrial n=1 Tax=Tieghemiomyces parasiticus TaxID=78921 RepID=A0A9W8AHD2_9FUNG|nr:39S ribosomal protein L16, mitochondrial [Tieghemiomyces parasiticus]